MANKNVLVFIENSRTYGRGLLRGIAKYARVLGSWNFFIRPEFYSQPGPFSDPGNFKDFLEHITQSGLDGIITRELPADLMQHITELNLPTIVIPYIKEFPPNVANRIVTDSEAIAEMVAKYYIEKGFRNFAYCGYDAMFWSQKRKKFFEAYLNDNNFPLYIYSTSEKIGEHNWYLEKERLAIWLKSLPKPVGILTCTDDRGLQLLEVCRYANIKTPEEVSIVGIDNDHLVCALSNIALSSVDLTTTQAGYDAAAMLERQMNGEEIPNFTIKIKPKRVITRQSSDILAIDDAKVARAMEFIRENSRSNIKVEDVVKAALSSRRVLEQNFKETLGVTIGDEIRRHKIERICELLTETNLPIKQIASITGFETSKHIARYFSRVKGINLQEFRNSFEKSI